MAAVVGAVPLQVPRVDDTIAIDGHLDEPAWARAEPITDFRRFQPTAGGAPPGRTEVRLLHDDRYLYVGVRISGADYPIRARISPREQINDDDQVGVYLDTFRDRRSGYVFYFNPLGIQQDIRVSIDSFSMSWDTVLRSRGHTTPDGFELEVAIPFRSLKYDTPHRGEGDAEREWGLILTRKVPSEGAKYGHPELVRDHPRLFSQARPIRLAPPRRGSGLELIPSFTATQGAARADGQREAPLAWSTQDPWYEVWRPSLDARFGITPNLGLAATLNPDFSQIEGDVTPTALNQRFAFFFEEQRPFFLDGGEYFSDAANTLYSRSIADPWYGLKLSGREGPVSVGVLQALDRSPTASVNENPTPGFSQEELGDAVASNHLVRLKLDAFREGFVGFTVGDKHVLGAAKGRWSGGGIDANVPLGGRWVASASSFQSFTGVAHRAPTWGYEVTGAVSRQSGVGTGLYVEAGHRSEGLRKELGFLNQSGITGATVWVDHTVEPGGLVDTVVPGAWVDLVLEAGGDAQRSAGAEVAAQVGGVHELDAEVSVSDIVEQGARLLPAWSAGASYAATLSGGVSVGADGGVGRELDYDALVPAHSGWVSLSTILRPTVGLRLDTRVSWASFAPAIGTRREAFQLRSKAAWQFSRTLGLRVIEEYTGGTGRDPILASSALLTWLHTPGTAAYLGYSERTDLAGAPRAVDRAVFAKISVLFRP